MESDILLACIHADKVLHLHAQPHEAVAEGFAVAEPRGDLTGECAVQQLLGGKLREFCQLALLQFRESASREGVEYDSKGSEDGAEEYEVGFTESHGFWFRIGCR